MCYKCAACGAVSKKGTPRIVWTRYRDVPGPFRVVCGEQFSETRKEIAQEVPVCQSCLTVLDSGVPLEVLVGQRGVVRRPAPGPGPATPVKAPARVAPIEPPMTPFALTPAILGARMRFSK